MIKKKLFFLLFLFALISPSWVQARLVIDGSSEFHQKVNHYIKDARNCSDHLEKLINAVVNSSKIIKITPITDDPLTWHASGEKTRSHTEAIDDLLRGSGRKTKTKAVIYINEDRITLNHKTYNRGTLIHEFVHALDLANGKYHGDYIIREKRAVFFQNIWRKTHQKALRSSYHGRFKTLEYQNAVASGKIKQFVEHYYSNNDIPDRKTMNEIN